MQGGILKCNVLRTRRDAGGAGKEKRMLDFLKKVLGNGNDTQLKKLEKPVGAVMALENEYRKLTSLVVGSIRSGIFWHPP